MISFDFSSHCTGCYACSDICPKHCIKLSENDRGFVVPVIDALDCIECHLCEKVCPVLSSAVLNPCRSVYCAYNKDEVERHEGSSGSIMLVLARVVLSKGGVVYGAAFDENLQLRHTRATTYEGVIKQSKSKYIQSDLNGVYQLVKQDLKANLPILFVGTPCQTQALYKCVSSFDKKNLILVDFICHGVPSQSLFNQSIAEFERKRDCKVIDFSFREKSNNYLRNYKVKYIKNGMLQEEMGREGQFPYYCGYLKYITFRDSCYECRFASSSRASDITLGDFWGMEKLSDFHKGYSLLYINTKKGQELLAQLTDLIDLNQFLIGDPVTYNFAYDNHQEKNIWQRVFVVMQKHFSYPIIEKFLFHNYKDVGLLHKFFFLLIGQIDKYIYKYKH